METVTYEEKIAELEDKLAEEIDHTYRRVIDRETVMESEPLIQALQDIERSQSSFQERLLTLPETAIPVMLTCYRRFLERQAEKLRSGAFY